ncbi:hypothetical protein [Alkalibacillus salilacus]|uniref:Uncharacterized protein n=1 Tax=Alkalibacillus salilacus TaxID=284582 RepID=A0ABT9VFW9_9BACI|nr:hypothetical protein [Alkalibacillus salilacus]MDQ0159755.1 hypothetical protein [Alkalibacillus salilacus]
MEANKKWLSIPKDIREKLITNVFCSNCRGSATITGFTIEYHEAGIVLKGECKACGNNVSRVVELD